MNTPDLLLEDYPDDLRRSIDQRDTWRRDMAAQGSDLEFIVRDLSRWVPGSTIKVAFLDGTSELHSKIAEVTTQITDACGLGVDFGMCEDTGEYRRWTAGDTEYAADIRVSFDQGGYWSLVGTDSVDASIGTGGIGGGPGQRSLNLGGYTQQLPDAWERTVLHEFLHALAFTHEHQNMRGPCQDEFRWDDDEGYERTTDNGRFVTDSEGRRPGIYTYLSGAPNHWSRSKIDHNLRAVADEETAAGNFDPASVMLYRFPALFYKTNPSECAPKGDGLNLSDGDRRGLKLLYPGAQEARAAHLDALSTALETLEQLGSANGDHESLGVDHFAASARLLRHLAD